MFVKYKSRPGGLLKRLLSRGSLDKRPAEQITAFLLANGGHDDPKQLEANAGKSYVGNVLLGMGFTFDDSGLADDDTPGIPAPIATMERLIADNPNNAEVIFPLIGYAEVAASPTHSHHRYVINFSDRREEECRRDWPDLMALVERKVKPERDQLKDNADGRRRKQVWWQFGRTTPALDSAIVGCSHVLLAGTQASAHFTFGTLSPDRIVFTSNLAVLANDSPAFFGLIQSRTHECWTRNFMATLEDRLVYTPSTCFENFPFPTALLDSAANAPTHESTRQSLEAIGERYHQFRAELMVRNDANDALDFQGQLQAYGAISGRRKLPWRYRWLDAVRDDVLARLLALNAERYEEEVAMGLHSKAAKQAARAGRASGGSGAPEGKRRGRPPKAGKQGETGANHSEQMGLGV